MAKTYRVKKILNNNVVLANLGFQEVVVMGLGIGYNLKPKSEIPFDKIEKVFEMKREDVYKIMSLAQEIDEDIFNNAFQIIKKNEEVFQMPLDNHAYLVLIDHINFSIERYKSNQDIKNLLFEDLRLMYPEELKMAMAILNDVNLKFEVNLPQDEAGFLVMHIVNGLNPDLNNKSALLTELVLDALNVIRDYYLVSLKPHELSSQRIMIHVKLLIQRIISSTQVDFKEEVLYNVFKDFPNAYTCAQKVQTFIETQLRTKINQQEMVYLTIHLNRLEILSHQ